MDRLGGDGIAGEIAIGEDELIAMAHGGQDLEQLRGEKGIEAFQHGSNSLLWDRAHSVDRPPARQSPSLAIVSRAMEGPRAMDDGGLPR